MLIEFPAVVNLFHAMVHSKHYMQGTWQYTNSEGQAIKEENIFRKEMETKEVLEREVDIEFEQLTVKTQICANEEVLPYEFKNVD